MFDIGDKVVCVDAGPKKGRIGPIVPVHHLLREGRVYTVADLSYSTNQRNRLTGETTLVFKTTPLVALAEVQLPPPMKGFESYRFRKIEPPMSPPEEVEQVRELTEV
ncbi:MAG: hypothetical protein EAY70_01935 [Sphingomonadales bacterium]|nr:MAG: hypothetical protein EAY70_01935 [Sphingomonadales bacterium]